MMSSNYYINGEIVVDKLKVFNNIRYEYYSSNSIIDQFIIRKSLQCAARCAQNPIYQTATFNEKNQICLLLTEIDLGQLLPDNESITFEYKRTNPTSPIFLTTSNLLSSSMQLTSFNISRTSTVSTTSVTANPSCTAAIPSFGTTWTCINVSSSISNGGNKRLYIKQNIQVSANNNEDITAYLESNAQLSATNDENLNVYLESNAILTATAGETMTLYLGVGAHVTAINCEGMTAYLESGATLSVSNGGSLTAYLKTNTTLQSTNGDSITIYYENNVHRTYSNNGATTETLCPSLIFDYSNIPPKAC
ncbi:unnamed protein product [Adineta steineri]|uniref:Uncharacterized protein n=1 Tax=Adineta steineri TaxID=433720 RepID=A0A819CC10_9BILA|nr:unnamed protein product [Adineta steineri]CAF3816892.1 unnamed protein product [Adineta steineri]